MKLFLIFMASISAGVASGEHLHSFMLGLSISALAVGSCYWFAFRSTRFPQLAVFLLLCGMLSKLTVTVVGVMWGVSADLMTSPLTFALSYLFFSIALTYLWFSYKDAITARPKWLAAK
ncbi:NADH:ubiquinone oxidoreductase [Vibrio sp. SCSIO 43135]|uniref:NADH:ubiquinone oxidoreductase n=1 Tax=Vibrio paucivorans TaxID=2829489 RepID=A0A9X3CE77_9VIBR|nr:MULTISPECIES: NADH:ubiquinone oxidoreductase [Vibrio]MCW8334116.1 NADH:ubiquinone oxidoreductase [Vibrio paucivorans]USD43746.1 NADH:ubiquinone oxidoreductase [Vibrio sp. SCSIO 43135]